MIRRLALLAAVAAAIGIAGCADERTAGGTGTGTDNILTATISVDSAMEPGAASRLAPTPLLLRLDSTNFVFDEARPDGADLRVSRPDGTPLPFALRDWSVEARRASLWVRLDSFRRGADDRIVLTWGDGDAPSVSDPAATWAAVPDSIRLDAASVLVADFESGTGALALPCGCNSFYTGGDSGVLSRPRQGAGIDSAIDSAGRGRAGKALHVVFSATGTRYGLIGSRLGHGVHRFGGLDSITIRARGTGAIRIALENGLDTTANSKAWAFIHPDSVWREYSIRPADFEAPAPAVRGWNAVRDSVSTLTLFLNEGGELWIDDIRLHGIAPSDVP